MKITLRLCLCLVPVFAGCNRNLTYGDTEPGTPEPSVTVFEYTPAPGQFIGDPMVFPEEITTPEEACEYAEERLDKGRFVSLGGFGGYIVVGFEESVENSGGSDFSVTGNQHAGSSEPGIVWVMKDVKGDGITDDDVWYELRGSETGKEGTIRNYRVEYSRPEDGRDVPWTDSEGANGVIPRNNYHKQSNYYPAWIPEESYTLCGTKLESRSSQDPSGDWVNAPYDWGYADNMGGDSGERADAGEVDRSGDRRKVYFAISNAIDIDGEPVSLDRIDFIKVQTAVNAVAGSDRLGELSTEVCGFAIEK